jgi:hypothetical protein
MFIVVKNKGGGAPLEKKSLKKEALERAGGGN